MPLSHALGVQIARQGNTNRITLMVFVEKHNLRISKHMKITATTPRLLGLLPVKSLIHPLLW